MKLLCTADIHIHDYNAYSKYDEQGIPSRLTSFEILAEDILKHAINNQCKAIVVAGDITHAAITRPMVNNCCKLFFEKLSSIKNIKVIVTIGQHDCDTKAQTSNPVHSLINSIIPNKENIIYINELETFTLEDVRFCVKPWSEEIINYEKLPDSDVFISHGLVSGSVDCHGYEFKSGFNSNKLLEKYQLSVIGDIHCGQVIKNLNENKILIPGSPIQTSFKDDPNCGLWIADTDKKTLNFTPIYDIRDDGTYHKFIYVDENFSENLDLRHVHIRVKESKRHKIDKIKNESDSFELGSKELLEYAINAVHETKPSNPNLYEEILHLAYQKTRFENNTIPSNQIILEIKIKNFLSIKDFSLDFTKAYGDILISGQNGVGKSALTDSIFYLLFGEIPRELSVKEIPNNNTESEMKVSGIMSVEGQKYQIERGRTSERNPILDIYYFKNNKWISQKQSNIKKTQEYISNIIGYSSQDILALSYFSTNQLSTFSNLGSSDKHSLLGKLSSKEQLESLRKSACELKSDFETEWQNLEGKLVEIDSNLISKKERLENITFSISSESDRSSIDKSVRDYIGKDLKSSSMGSIRDYLKSRRKVIISSYNEENQERYELLSKEVKKIEFKLESNKRELSRKEYKLTSLKDKIREAKSGKCPECGNILEENKHLVTKYDDQMKILQKSLKKEKESYEKNKELYEVLRNKYISVESINKINHKIKMELRDLDLLLEKVESFLEKTSLERKETEKQICREEIEKLSKRKQIVSSEKDKVSEKVRVSKKILSDILSRSGIVATKIAKNVCSSLSESMNLMINDKKIFFSEVLPGKNIEIRASFNGKKPVSIRGMSGGQRRFTDILIMIALNNMFSKKYQLKNGLMGIVIYDEVFNYLDEIYLDLIHTALQCSISRTRLILTHENRLQSYFDKIIQVSLNEENQSNYDLIGF